MVANALLTNPTLFSGENITTMVCAQRWIDICFNSTLTKEEYERVLLLENYTPFIRERPYNLTFQCFHHHLVFMLEKLMPRRKRREFNAYTTFKQVLDFLHHEFNLAPKLFTAEEYYKNCNTDVNYLEHLSVSDNLYLDVTENEYDYDVKKGKYFENKTSFSHVEEDDSVSLDGLFS